MSKDLLQLESFRLLGMKNPKSSNICRCGTTFKSIDFKRLHSGASIELNFIEFDKGFKNIFRDY